MWKQLLETQTEAIVAPDLLNEILLSIFLIRMLSYDGGVQGYVMCKYITFRCIQGNKFYQCCECCTGHERETLNTVVFFDLGIGINTLLLKSNIHRPRYVGLLIVDVTLPLCIMNRSSSNIFLISSLVLIIIILYGCFHYLRVLHWSYFLSFMLFYHL